MTSGSVGYRKFLPWLGLARPKGAGAGDMTIEGRESRVAYNLCCMACSRIRAYNPGSAPVTGVMAPHRNAACAIAKIPSPSCFRGEQLTILDNVKSSFGKTIELIPCEVNDDETHRYENGRSVGCAALQYRRRACLGARRSESGALPRASRDPLRCGFRHCRQS